MRPHTHATLYTVYVSTYRLNRFSGIFDSCTYSMIFSWPLSSFSSLSFSSTHTYTLFLSPQSTTIPEEHALWMPPLFFSNLLFLLQLSQLLFLLLLTRKWTEIEFITTDRPLYQCWAINLRTVVKYITDFWLKNNKWQQNSNPLYYSLFL